MKTVQSSSGVTKYGIAVLACAAAVACVALVEN